MTMTVTLAIALALLIVSVVMAALTSAWNQPLVWIGWAFSVIYILGPITGR
jgi:hypothetical protein